MNERYILSARTAQQLSRLLRQSSTIPGPASTPNRSPEQTVAKIEAHEGAGLYKAIEVFWTGAAWVSDANISRKFGTAYSTPPLLNLSGSTTVTVNTIVRIVPVYVKDDTSLPIWIFGESAGSSFPTSSVTSIDRALVVDISGTQGWVGVQTVTTAPYRARVIEADKTEHLSELISVTFQQGPQGLGTQGVQGPQGRQGVQGTQGFQGVQGVQGFQGIQGFQGVQGAQGFQGLGLQGSEGSQGALGLQGSAGMQGDKGEDGNDGEDGADGFQGYQGPEGLKTAIVETSQGCRELCCIEGPEVWFFDVILAQLENKSGKATIDPLFVDACEPLSIHIVSLAASEPIAVGGKIIDNCVVVESGKKSTATVTVMLAGIRKGFSGRRFATRTIDEMHKNNEFWQRAVK
jgi:hypothetical protein